MARGETVQARVPPAVRPCPRGRHADGCSMPRVTAPRCHILICGQAGHNVGLGIHSLTGEDLLVYVSPCWQRTGTRAGWSVIDLLYCCRVFFIARDIIALVVGRGVQILVTAWTNSQFDNIPERSSLLRLRSSDLGSLSSGSDIFTVFSPILQS